MIKPDKNCKKHEQNDSDCSLMRRTLHQHDDDDPCDIRTTRSHRIFLLTVENVDFECVSVLDWFAPSSGSINGNETFLRYI